MSLEQEYLEANTLRGIALPSGLKVTVRPLTPAQLGRIFKGLPSFAPVEGEVTKVDTDAAELSNKLTICLAVDEIVDVAEGEPAPEGKIPYRVLIAADVLFLSEVIGSLTGIEGERAEKARELFRKRLEALSVS